MGASSWVSRVDYRSDIAEALDEARRAAFRAGDFHRAPEDLAVAMTTTEDEFVEWYADEIGDDEETARLTWRTARVEPEDPDSLLLIQPFSGTHSVIDMVQVGEQPDYNTVAPIPDGKLDELFGTRTPTTEAVVEAADEGRLEIWDRWHGAYAIGYDADGEPEAIVFAGFSGD